MIDKKIDRVIELLKRDYPDAEIICIFEREVVFYPNPDKSIFTMSAQYNEHGIILGVFDDF